MLMAVSTFLKKIKQNGLGIVSNAEKIQSEININKMLRLQKHKRPSQTKRIIMEKKITSVVNFLMRNASRKLIER